MSAPMPVLAPEMRRVLDQLAAAAAGSPGRYDLPFPEARRALEQERAAWAAGAPDMWRVTDATITAAGWPVALRLYEPAAAAGAVVMLYLHGGGWCVGSLATHDRIMRSLAAASGLAVLGIDYPLAPEAPFPAALEVTTFLLGQSALPLGDRRVPVGRWLAAGDSAGANLALAATMRLRDRGALLPAGLLLYYGCYDRNFQTDSYRRFGDGRFGLSVAAMRHYWDAYLRAGTGGDVAGAFPLRGHLRGLPPCFVLAAACDVLHDDSATLAAALRKAGVTVSDTTAAGMVHGFLAYGMALPQANAALAAGGRWAADIGTRCGAASGARAYSAMPK